MKTNNKGFTLIELIMVIVILGILAAVVVPKFFDLTTQAHTKNKTAVLGNIRAGLQLYAANELVTNGSRAFPISGTTAGPMALGDILDEVPEGWSILASTATVDTIAYHYGTGNEDYDCFLYTSDGTSFTIGAEVAR